MIDLVGKLVTTTYPNFTEDKAEMVPWSDGDRTYEEYYDPQNSKLIFAKYWIWEEQLQLNSNLFEILQNFFGDDLTFVIDWFNNEFDRDAESVSYF